MYSSNDEHQKCGSLSVRPSVFVRVAREAANKRENFSPPPPPPKTCRLILIQRVGRDAQKREFRYLGAAGLMAEEVEITHTPEVNHQSRASWGRRENFSQEHFDRQSAPCRLKARLLNAEAMEALLVGCMPLGTTPQPLLRVRVMADSPSTDHIYVYCDALSDTTIAMFGAGRLRSGNVRQSVPKDREPMCGSDYANRRDLYSREELWLDNTTGESTSGSCSENLQGGVERTRAEAVRRITDENRWSTISKLSEARTVRRREAEYHSESAPPCGQRPPRIRIERRGTRG